ncbi:MAG: clostripain-related cysteine peptidase [Defluviitaleaceae bacterium]|nr:clostripain-related cysteine peptidase [Defluviitaleaceae bacterium]MCL2263564.1 clostripain-related cysteine peptidase [Defluviitaleaceae bacterium]
MKKNIWLLMAIIFAVSGCGAAHDEIIEAHAVTPYTIMVYMNGSDLESEFGAATDDLAEMLDSGLDSRNANVLILTGGANRWQNDAIPETECVIWQLADGFLYEQKNMGRVNMGNPNTLRDFIKFCMENFPAQKYGLIMWDHGGGSIAGFGHDEKFDDASLTLLDMKKAFAEAGLAENKLEFLGFDACLMATVEMAVLASEFARVLIAAEDLEPGEGWDYMFLVALNANPHMSGFELGEIIVDTFIEFFERIGVADEEILTLSVIDLENVAPVMDAMGELMVRASQSNFDPNAFYRMAVRRANTKTFGEGSPRDNYADMVDIGDMAIQLADLYPREAAAVLHALANCVTYNRHNSDVEIFGLSTFYIYGGKSEGEPSLRTYSALQMDDAYTQFLHRFFDGLIRTNSNAETVCTKRVLWQHIEGEKYRMAGLQTGHENWPRINGEWVTLFPVTATANARRYAIPAQVNGNAADIIVIFTDENPRGKILGIRHNAENVFQKGYDPISMGDEIAFEYLVYNFATQTESWHKTEPFTVTAAPRLVWQPAPAAFSLGYRRTDIFKNVSYVL